MRSVEQNLQQKLELLVSAAPIVALSDSEVMLNVYSTGQTPNATLLSPQMKKKIPLIQKESQTRPSQINQYKNQ